MDVPDAALVRTWSHVDLDALNYADDPGLQVLCDRAAEYVTNMTGREFADMPTGLSQTASEAVQRRTEQLARASQDESVETVTDGLASFNAGGYSENRLSPDAAKKAGLVNPWPLLSDLLWRLMTEEKRAEWLSWLSGKPVPSFEVTEYAYGGTYAQDFGVDSLWGA